MRKGFTLIELLAVIVILAIIALIATPIVLNIINDTKESATIRGAGFYIDALENAIALENIREGGSFNPSNCEVIDDKGTMKCDDNHEVEIKVDGEVPKIGSKVTFEDGKITYVNLIYESGTITKNEEGEMVFDEAKTIIVGSATFDDGVTLTWDELKLPANGTKYGYDASKISDTEIGDMAFYGCTTITNIIISSSVTSIGNSAFQDSSLKKIEIPEGVISIGDSAFAGMIDCEPIVLPDSITTLGSFIVEAGPSILNVSKNLTNITSNTFYQWFPSPIDMSKCTNLKIIYIGDMQAEEIILPNTIEIIKIVTSDTEKSIKFNGTIEEFEKITIEYDEGYGIYSIHIDVECKDGTKTIERIEIY